MRPNRHDLSLFQLMARAGCQTIYLGIESGSSRILTAVKKDVTPEQARSCVELINSCGMRSHGLFMAGFPEETEADLLATLEFLHTVPLNSAVVSFFTYLAGSEIYERDVASGKISKRDFSVAENTGFRLEDLRGIGQQRFLEIAKRIIEEVKRINHRDASHIWRFYLKRKFFVAHPMLAVSKLAQFGYRCLTKRPRERK